MILFAVVNFDLIVKEMPPADLPRLEWSCLEVALDKWCYVLQELMLKIIIINHYKSIIRPVLGYVCPVWKSGLFTRQSRAIESHYRRDMHIILGNVNEFFTFGTQNFVLKTLITKSLIDKRKRQRALLHKPKKRFRVHNNWEIGSVWFDDIFL